MASHSGISLIVLTSPGRESSLQWCLTALQRQMTVPQEIIVVDDGSTGGQAIVNAFADTMPIQYLWRSNDQCPSRSRNLGAAQARGKWLVFIDADILLHPRALSVYNQLLEAQQQAILFGYFGSIVGRQAPSIWYAERQVNYLDRRFPCYHHDQLIPYADLFRFPGEYAWSGNFALAASTYQQSGGFDEDFVGWGDEDVAFATQVLQQGIHIHFVIDAWGEHQVHSYQEPFHTKLKSGQKLALPPYEVSYPVKVLSSPTGLQDLLNHVFNSYLAQDQGLSVSIKQQLQHPNAVFELT